MNVRLFKYIRWFVRNRMRKKIETIYFWSKARVLVSRSHMSLSKSTQSNIIDKQEMIRLCCIVSCRRNGMKHKNRNKNIKYKKKVKYVKICVPGECLKINVDFEDVKRNANFISHWQMLWRDSVVTQMAAFNAFREFKWFALQEFSGIFCGTYSWTHEHSHLNSGSVIVSGRRWNDSGPYFARNIAKYTV